MNCPKCDNVVLNAETYEAVEIDRCPQCKGTWLDDGEIIKIIRTKEESFSPEFIKETISLAFSGVPKQEQQNVVKCPQCQAGMKAVNYDYSSGIIIDRCIACRGLWLDGKELEKVQAVREHSESEFEKNKDDWILLANSAIENKEKTEKEKRHASKTFIGCIADTISRSFIR